MNIRILPNCHVGAGFARLNAPTDISVDTAARVFSGRQTLPLQSFYALPAKQSDVSLVYLNAGRRAVHIVKRGS